MQGQDLSCRCEVCLYQLKILRSDGLDPTIQDVMNQKQKHDKLLQKQPSCDERMKEVKQKEQEHKKQLIEMQKQVDFNFQKDIL